MDPARILEFMLADALTKRYGSPLPVSVKIEPSTFMHGVNVVVGVVGQTRGVFISDKRLSLLAAGQELWPAVVEDIVDEVKFAIYLLLDEDEDEE